MKIILYYWTKKIKNNKITKTNKQRVFSKQNK